MRFTFKKIIISALALGLVSTLSAQEGHPVKGSWIGEWEGNPLGESILMVMDWDGEKISGVINPGTDDLKSIQQPLMPMTGQSTSKLAITK